MDEEKSRKGRKAGTEKFVSLNHLCHSATPPLLRHRIPAVMLVPATLAPSQAGHNMALRSKFEKEPQKESYKDCRKMTEQIKMGLIFKSLPGTRTQDGI